MEGDSSFDGRMTFVNCTGLDKSEKILSFTYSINVSGGCCTYSAGCIEMWAREIEINTAGIPQVHLYSFEDNYCILLIEKLVSGSLEIGVLANLFWVFRLLKEYLDHEVWVFKVQR